MIDTFIRQYIEAYAGYNTGKWCYEDGCFYKGVADLYLATGDQWFYDQLVRYINKQILPNGNINGYDPKQYRLDDINAGKVLFLLNEKTSDVRYLIALRKLREQIRTQPRTKSGNFWHKKSCPNHVWLEGLYMGLPFWAQYCLVFEKGENLIDIHQQFSNARNLLFDYKKGLYCHGYDETCQGCWADRDSGRSTCFFSQAIGCHMMALADLCEIVGRGHQDFIFYARLLKEISETILTWQQPEGLWLQLMDQPSADGNYLETAASAMFAYALLKGTRLSILSDHHFKAGQNAFEGIVEYHLKLKEGNYTLGGICKNVGLKSDSNQESKHNGSSDDYINEPVVSNDPKGVGPFMMARAELLRLNFS